MRTNSARSPKQEASKSSIDFAGSAASETAPGTMGGAIGQMVGRALSVKPRGAMKRDGLVVQNLTARLCVQLLARPIHPWDRDRPADERNELFVQQCLEDVSTAIPNLFRSMPEIQEMEITVLDPKGRTAIIAGIVNRGDALASNGFAAGMKLKVMGLAYGRTNSGFEVMDEHRVLILNARERA